MKKNMNLVLISSLIIVIVGLIFYIIKSNNDKEILDNKTYVADNTLINITKSETSSEIIYEVIDNGKKLRYSWTFNKDENMMKALKDNMEIDMSLKLNILDKIENSELDSKVTNEDKLIISFEHHGKLPTKAKINLDVSDRYKDGEKLYLYYYNEEENQIEYIDSGIPVKNGHVEFEIDHCSDYLLTASIVQEAVNNPKNINLIIIVMVVVIIVLIGATLMQNKK